MARMARTATLGFKIFRIGQVEFRLVAIELSGPASRSYHRNWRSARGPPNDRLHSSFHLPVDGPAMSSCSPCVPTALLQYFQGVPLGAKDDRARGFPIECLGKPRAMALGEFDLFVSVGSQSFEMLLFFSRAVWGQCARLRPSLQAHARPALECTKSLDFKALPDLGLPLPSVR